MLLPLPRLCMTLAKLLPVWSPSACPGGELNLPGQVWEGGVLCDGDGQGTLVLAVLCTQHPSTE